MDKYGRQIMSVITFRNRINFISLMKLIDFISPIRLIVAYIATRGRACERGPGGMGDETACLKQEAYDADGGQEPADGAGDAPVAASGGELFAAALIHSRHHEVAE